MRVLLVTFKQRVAGAVVCDFLPLYAIQINRQHQSSFGPSIQYARRKLRNALISGRHIL
jgi:hypothetical protein